MKTRWRRIFYVVMIVNLIVGLVLTIVYTVRASSFTTFLSNFMSTIAQTAFWAFLIEHCGNVEKGIDSARSAPTARQRIFGISRFYTQYVLGTAEHSGAAGSACKTRATRSTCSACATRSTRASTHGFR